MLFLRSYNVCCRRRRANEAGFLSAAGIETGFAKADSGGALGAGRFRRNQGSNRIKPPPRACSQAVHKGEGTGKEFCSVIVSIKTINANQLEPPVLTEKREDRNEVGPPADKLKKSRLCLCSIEASEQVNSPVVQTKEAMVREARICRSRSL